MAVELLAACCEKASPEDLEQLGRACFALADDARWDEGERKWVWQEFALLRLAAMAADRPGHMLLIHSLERAFRGMATWIKPHLDSKSVNDWAWFVMQALVEKDAQKLRTALPSQLQASDELLLRRLVPPSQPTTECEAHSTQSAPSAHEPSVPEAPEVGGTGEVSANLSDSWTGSYELPPTGTCPPEAAADGTWSGPEPAAPVEGLARASEESGGSARLRYLASAGDRVDEDEGLARGESSGGAWESGSLPVPDSPVTCETGEAVQGDEALSCAARAPPSPRR